MRVLIGSVAPRAGAGPTQQMLDEYLRRIGAYLPTEAQVFRTEAAFLEKLARGKGRAAVVLLDGRGESMASEGLARMLEEHKMAGTQLLVFGVGPADGWSEGARAGAGQLLSLGPMTLPHELARVVLAEQVYRACTILAGHPYHSGH